jgi:FkbM family methyltransferase
MTNSWAAKLRTLSRYVSLGVRLGADARSRWLLATRLPLLRARRRLGLRDDPPRRAVLRIGGGLVPVWLRAEDVFPLADVFEGDGYLWDGLRDDPPRAILDLGAHIGLASLRFAAAFPESTIHAYEPDPDNLVLLRRNLAGLQRATIHAEAIGARAGDSLLYTRPGRHTSGSLLRPGYETEVRPVPCAVRSLDEAIDDAGGADLIKFDIEGAELAVFTASARVHQVRCIVGELKGTPDSVRTLCDALPEHRAEIRSVAPGMHLLLLTRR